MVSVHFSIVLRGRPRRGGTSSSPNLDAVCSAQAVNLHLTESDGKRKKELTLFFPKCHSVRLGGETKDWEIKGAGVAVIDISFPLVDAMMVASPLSSRGIFVESETFHSAWCSFLCGFVRPNENPYRQL